VVRRHFMALAAFLVQPHPPALALRVIVLDIHVQGGRDPGKAIDSEPAEAFAFAGLIEDRGQSKGRPDSLGALEAGRNVDGGGEGHGYYRPGPTS